MRVGSIIKTGIVSGMMAISAGCQKTPYKPMMSAPKNVTQKVDSLIKESEKIAKDTSYIFFGKDTLELTEKFIKNTPKYLKNMLKRAEKNTPRVKTGQHLENTMFPKTGGGFDIIPVMKNDYSPVYTNQKVVVKSDSLFTKDGKDMYLPVEYYGQKNNNLKIKNVHVITTTL